MKEALIFSTCFDQNYLAKGIALYKSLKMCTKNFKLYIYAFDDKTFDLIKGLKFPEIVPVAFSELEDSELLAIKASRSLAEYFWTCTSRIILHTLKHFNEPSCIYIDADLYFFSDPNVLVQQLGKASIGITKHGFSHEYKHLVCYGIYNVQFLFFRNDEKSIQVLEWWWQACREWCYNRLEEDGKFGDQGYLNDWTERFDGVHVFHDNGSILGPWNIQRFIVTEDHGRLKATENEKLIEVVFYHFHALRTIKVDSQSYGYRIPLSAEKLIYYPYILLLKKISFLFSKIILGRWSIEQARVKLTNLLSLDEKVRTRITQSLWRNMKFYFVTIGRNLKMRLMKLKSVLVKLMKFFVKQFS